MTQLIKTVFIITLLTNILLSAENEKPVKLVLSAEQTHFIRKMDPVDKKYKYVKAGIKVMATYSDGHRKEVADRVEWLGLVKGRMVARTDYFLARRGTYTLRASLQGVVSNEITIKVEDDPSLVQHSEINRRPKLVLTAPRLLERKGAVRGASIKFRVTATRERLNYRLVEFQKV